jgi:hypothetical protein
MTTADGGATESGKRVTDERGLYEKHPLAVVTLGFDALCGVGAVVLYLFLFYELAAMLVAFAVVVTFVIVLFVAIPVALLQRYGDRLAA